MQGNYIGASAAVRHEHSRRVPDIQNVGSIVSEHIRGSAHRILHGEGICSGAQQNVQCFNSRIINPDLHAKARDQAVGHGARVGGRIECIGDVQNIGLHGRARGGATALDEKVACKLRITLDAVETKHRGARTTIQHKPGI